MQMFFITLFESDYSIPITLKCFTIQIIVCVVKLIFLNFFFTLLKITYKSIRKILVSS